MSTEQWIQMIAPALTSAGGALLAVKVMYGRIREDIAELKEEVGEMKDQFVDQTIKTTREYGEVGKQIGILQGRMDKMTTRYS